MRRLLRSVMRCSVLRALRGMVSIANMGISNRLERARDALRLAIEELDDVKRWYTADSDEVAEAQADVSACEAACDELEEDER